MIDLRKAKRVLAGVLIVEMVAIGATHAVRHFAPSNNATIATADPEALAAEIEKAKDSLTISFEDYIKESAYQGIDWSISNESLNEFNEERSKATGFDTGLCFPYSGVVQEDGHHYTDEQVKVMRDEELKITVKDIPKEKADFEMYKHVYMLDGSNLADMNSSWVYPGLELMEKAYRDGKGLADLIQSDGNGGWEPIDQLKPYLWASYKLKKAFGKTEVYRVYSDMNWGVNRITLAERAIKNHPEVAADPRLVDLYVEATTFETEDRDALVFSYVLKDGTTFAQIIFNVHDKRPMIPGKKPKPEETTVTETTPQETPQETTPAETKPHKRPTVNQETTPAPTTQETKPHKKPRRDPKETTSKETTPAETKPKETTPAETKPKETTPAETKPQKKRKSDSFNNGGANDGGNSARIGTDVFEPSDPHTETGKGHGDPVKETMVAPTTAASHKDIETQKSDEHRMNQETHTAAPTGERLTGDDGKQIQFGGDASKAAQENVEVNTNDAVEFEDNND